MSDPSEEPITFHPAVEAWIRETVREFEETQEVEKYELRLRWALLDKRFDVQYSTGPAGGD